MRHRKHRGSLGLPSGHRRAVLANLATALLEHGRIKTTEAKARAVRPYVEKLITLGKRGDLHARRQAPAKSRCRPVVDRLFNDVAPGYSEREGGYTRIIKTGFRVGDAAHMAIIELVEQGEVTKKKKAKPKTAAKKPEAKTEKAAKPEAKAETEEKAEEAAEAKEEAEAKAEEKVEAKAEEAAAEEKAESAADTEAGEEAKDK